MFNVRCTEEEYVVFKAAAKGMGKSLSLWAVEAMGRDVGRRGGKPFAKGCVSFHSPGVRCGECGGDRW